MLWKHFETRSRGFGETIARAGLAERVNSDYGRSMNQWKSRPLIRGALLCVMGLVAALACSSTPPPKEPSKLEKAGLTACPADQARRFFCDELLPLESSFHAPEPYETCPGAFEPPGEEDSPVGAFDSNYTAFIRQRIPPGSACCYSWCEQVKVADPELADPPVRCRMPTGIAESYCFHQMETATSDPAAAPYDRCPRAVVPSTRDVFSVPKAALLDSAASAKKSQENRTPECCYTWCSKAPSGVEMETD
jgi:hypothetical protein